MLGNVARKSKNTPREELMQATAQPFNAHAGVHVRDVLRQGVLLSLPTPDKSALLSAIVARHMLRNGGAHRRLTRPSGTRSGTWR